MSSNNFPFAFLALALGGLSLSALAVSQTGSAALDPQPEDQIAEEAPLCSVGTEKSGRGVILSAQVSPDETMVGPYSLAVTRTSGSNRTKIRQGGGFEAPGGETTLLSMSSFNSAEGLDAELTLKVGGKTIDCAFTDYPLNS